MISFLCYVLFLGAILALALALTRALGRVPSSPIGETRCNFARGFLNAKLSLSLRVELGRKTRRQYQFFCSPTPFIPTSNRSHGLRRCAIYSLLHMPPSSASVAALVPHCLSALSNLHSVFFPFIAFSCYQQHPLLKYSGLLLILVELMD